MTRLSQIAASQDRVPLSPRDMPAASEANAAGSIARVAGEAFDADQLAWRCDACGHDDLCMCEDEPTGPSATSLAVAAYIKNWTVTVKDHGDGRSELAA